MTLSGNSLRQTVHTHRAFVHQAAKLVAVLLRVARVTAGLAESNGSLLPGLWLTSPAGWLPRTRISSETLCLAIEYGLPFTFFCTLVRLITEFSWTATIEHIPQSHLVRHAPCMTWAQWWTVSTSCCPRAGHERCPRYDCEPESPARRIHPHSTHTASPTDSQKNTWQATRKSRC